MAVALYTDHNVRAAITAGLWRLGVDVLTAREDAAHELPDPDLLRRATALGRVLFTEDDDLLSEGARCQREAIEFSGIVYAHQRRVAVGDCIEDLELIAKAGEPVDLRNKVYFLPLRRRNRR